MTNNLKVSAPTTVATPSNGKFTRSSSTSGRTQRPSSTTGQHTHSQGHPKGKSKYSQKSRGKSKGPVAVKQGPSNTYTSVCCGAPATKPACVRVDKKKALEQGMGSWRCTGCKKSCKVTVSKYKAPEALPVEVPNAS